MTRISIVEDIPEAREALKKKINQALDLQCVSDYGYAEDALRNLPRVKPDLVLMDIVFPPGFMNGIECMLRIKLKHPDIDFLMFTQYDHDEKVFDALKGGAIGYVLKRERVEGVMRAIQEWRQGGAPMSREIAHKVLKSFHRFGPDSQLAENLTAREMEVLKFLEMGLLYKEIANRLNPPIGEGTVRQHIHRIYRKLEVNNRLDAIKKYLNISHIPKDGESLGKE